MAIEYLETPTLYIIHALCAVFQIVVIDMIVQLRYMSPQGFKLSTSQLYSNRSPTALSSGYAKGAYRNDVLLKFPIRLAHLIGKSFQHVGKNVCTRGGFNFYTLEGLIGVLVT